MPVLSQGRAVLDHACRADRGQRLEALSPLGYEQVLTMQLDNRRGYRKGAHLARTGFSSSGRMWPDMSCWKGGGAAMCLCCAMSRVAVSITAHICTHRPHELA